MSWLSQTVNYLANQSGYTGSTLDEFGQSFEDSVTQLYDEITGTVNDAVDGSIAVSGSYESGEFNPNFYMGPGTFGGFDMGYTWQDFTSDAEQFWDDVTPDSAQDLSNQISDNTPDIKNTVTSIQDLADATGYTNSDLDNLGQQAEAAANAVLGYKGGTTSPDPTGTVQSTINNLTPSGDDLLNTGINIITPPGTPGPGTGSTPQPTIAAGDTSKSVKSTSSGLDEQVVVGASRRPQAMAGRRKTMLTIGQTAAKLNAKRSAGY